MASLLEQSQLSSVSTAPTPNRGKLEEPDHSSSNWYFSREEIEKQSPSRLDGIDMKKETYFRKSYCTFLQDLGMRLKVPQVTIATAIVFCHRFFHRQSHAKNDRHTIATACMFLAGKVEETPQSLKNVILVSYEIRNKKDPAAIQRIKQKEVYEQQKELVCVAEKFVLAILGFDLNVHHPYKPLVAAIKKFKVAQNALAQVAWNFVNDGLRTSLCLQFKPHHIAAGAIFLAAKFLKVKLPSDGEVVWWQEFDVTPLQLEDVSNQMLELYEQNRPAPLGRGSDIGGSSGVNNHHNIGSHAPSNGASQRAGYSSPGTANTAIGIEAAHAQNVSDEANDSMKYASNASQHRQNEDSSHTDNIQSDNAEESAGRRKYAEASDRPTDISDESQQEDPVPNLRGREKLDGGNGSPKLNRTGDEIRVKREADNDDGKKTWVGIGDVNKDKVKAALEKRRKSRGEVGKPSKPKTELIDEDDLIERELESGVEAAFSQSEKAKQDRRESWGRTSHRPDQGEMDVKRDQQDEDENGRKRRKTILDAPPEKRPRSDDDLEGKAERNRVTDNPHDITEEGELPEFSAYDQSHSPRSGDKRSISPLSSQYEKGGSPGRRREHGARDQPVSRDLSHDKHRHSNHHYNHSSHYNQQHRPEVDRDRHHYKEREKQERDYKKSRHDHGK